MDCNIYEKHIKRLERELAREKKQHADDYANAGERISELEAKVNFSENCTKEIGGYPCKSNMYDNKLHLVYVKTSNKKNIYHVINFLYCGDCGEMYKIKNEHCQFGTRNVKCKVCVEVD